MFRYNRFVGSRAAVPPRPKRQGAKAALAAALASDVLAFEIEVRAALLALEIGAHIPKGIHGAAQALAHELIELDCLREREVPAHLGGDLVVLQRRQMARADLSGDLGGMGLKLCGGHGHGDDAQLIGLDP